MLSIPWGAALWVPVSHDEQVVAALGVGRERPFTSREAELLEGFASQVSLAWTFDRAQRELHRLSVLADRERIGRDLHDTVIQRLFATGLSLQATIRRHDDRPGTRRAPRAGGRRHRCDRQGDPLDELRAPGRR